MHACVHAQSGLADTWGVPPCLPACLSAHCSLTFFFAYNALARYDPYQRWRIRLESLARRLGCAEDLNSTGQWEGER